MNQWHTYKLLQVPENPDKRPMTKRQGSYQTGMIVNAVLYVKYDGNAWENLFLLLFFIFWLLYRSED